MKKSRPDDMCIRAGHIQGNLAPRVCEAARPSARFGAKFCPQGNIRGKEFLSRDCAQKWVPPKAWRLCDTLTVCPAGQAVFCLFAHSAKTCYNGGRTAFHRGIVAVNDTEGTMAREIDPVQTPRAAAAVWMQAPMPMLTLFETLDVTPLLRLSRRHKLKFHMLLCWCIGRAAARTPEFALLPVGGKLMQYDKLAVNTVVALEGGGINTCDIPVSDSLIRFNRDYLALTGLVRRTGQAHELGEDYMVIGTSALPGNKIDGAVNIYAGIYNNPFLIWGSYRRQIFRAKLPISFQFHHTQMDGMEAARFLDRLQAEINRAGGQGGLL